MGIEEKIIDKIKLAFTSLYNHDLGDQDLQLQPTRKDFEGNFTFVTFPFLRVTKSSPEQAGEAIGQYLVEELEEVSSFNVVKGFLNVAVTDDVLGSTISTILNNDDFATGAPNGVKVMVEYSSPNTNKPLHLGHLRNNFLGYSIAEILKANGYEVTKANLINDRGIHICKSMLAYQKFGDGETPESAQVKGDKLIGNYYVKFDQEYKKEIQTLIDQGISEEEAKNQAPLIQEAREMLLKWEQNDADTRALWSKMNQWVYDGFEATYSMIGVDFDQYYYESNTYLLGKDLVEEGLEKKQFYQKEDNSTWVDLSSGKLDDKLVLRGDGTSVYMTQDMGTADLKYQDYQVDKSIYVVGNEQDHHFKVLQLILQKLGRPYADGIYHMSYGMVDLPSGKMKSREGTVVDADDLIQEMLDTAEQRTKELNKTDGFSEEEAQELYRKLALGALKYYLLRVDPKKRMLFNPAESIEFQGNTGPAIQYTYSRICSILNKAEEMDISLLNYTLPDGLVLEGLEKQIPEMLHEFSKVLKNAGEEYSPSLIANYVYDLSKEYNSFYNGYPIFKEENEQKRQYRVALSAAVGKVIKKACALLGIEVPEKM